MELKINVAENRNFTKTRKEAVDFAKGILTRDWSAYLFI